MRFLRQSVLILLLSLCGGAFAQQADPTLAPQVAPLAADQTAPKQIATAPDPVGSSAPTIPQNARHNWVLTGDLVRTVLLAFTVLFSCIALIFNIRTYTNGLQPFLQMQESADTVTMTAEGFDQGGEKTPFFRITNHGKSPAILVGLHREWAIVPKLGNPRPIEYSKKSEHENYKSTHHIVGSGDFLEVRGLVPTDLSFPIDKKDIIHFYGYVEFSDMAGRNRYVSGFDLVYEHSRFHTAWPKTDSHKFKYHKKVSR